MAVKKYSELLRYKTEIKVVGVFCPEKDYRLCWLINNQLRYDFKKTLDFIYPTTQNPEGASFSVYTFERPTLQQSYFLVNNRSHDNQTLFSKPQGLDFLLLINADDSRYNYTQLLKSLRSLSQINAAYMLDDALGKLKESFLYDFELFLSQELKL